MGRYTDKKKGLENKQRAYNYLVKDKGLTPHVAAGILGNLMQESGHNLSTKAYNPDDLGSPSYGLAQWRGSRLDKLKEFAGDNISKLSTQLDFLVHELNTTEKRAMDKLKESKNAEEAAQIVSKYYERPHKDYAHNDKRVSNAKEVYLQFNDSNIYAKDDKDKVVILNPEVATEVDKKQSPAIKREFYEQHFNIENKRPKVPEPAPISEAKEEINQTRKEIDFKNRIGDILSKSQAQNSTAQVEPRQFNFEAAEIRVPENEFYSSFLEEGGEVEACQCGCPGKPPCPEKPKAEDNFENAQNLYDPIYKKIAGAYGYGEGWEDYDKFINDKRIHPYIRKGLDDAFGYTAEDLSNGKRSIPPVDKSIEKLQQVILNTPDAELRELLKKDYGEAGILNMGSYLPEEVGLLEALGYASKFKKLKKQGYTFNKGGRIRRK